MTQHTPGPWRHDKERHAIVSDSHWFVEPDENDPDGIPTSVIDLWGAMGGTDTNADTALIAAAPELLKALQRLADKAESVMGDHKAAIIDARAAIAKAMGKS